MTSARFMLLDRHKYHAFEMSKFFFFFLYINIHPLDSNEKSNFRFGKIREHFKRKVKLNSFNNINRVQFSVIKLKGIHLKSLTSIPANGQCIV